MKRVTLVALFCASALLLRADILSNGNFADGTAHWEGDARQSDDATTPGITITLNPTQWTKVSQVFNTHEDSLNFSASYKTSPNLSFTSGTATADPKAPNKQVLSPADVGDLTGTRIKGSIHLDDGTWLFMLIDRAEGLTTWFKIKPKLGSTDIQTIAGSFPKLAAHEEKVLVLCFPPGNGTITLTNIALTPTAGSTPPPAQ